MAAHLAVQCARCFILTRALFGLVRLAEDGSVPPAPPSELTSTAPPGRAPASPALAAPAGHCRRRAAARAVQRCAGPAAWLGASHRRRTPELRLAATMSRHGGVQQLDDVDLTFNGRFHIHKELNRASICARWARKPSAARSDVPRPGGATAVVFEAMDMHNSRLVALKARVTAAQRRRGAE